MTLVLEEERGWTGLMILGVEALGAGTGAVVLEAGGVLEDPPLARAPK